MWLRVPILTVHLFLYFFTVIYLVRTLYKNKYCCMGCSLVKGELICCTLQKATNSRYHLSINFTLSLFHMWRYAIIYGRLKRYNRIIVIKAGANLDHDNKVALMMIMTNNWSFIFITHVSSDHYKVQITQVAEMQTITFFLFNIFLENKMMMMRWCLFVFFTFTFLCLKYCCCIN